MKKPLRRRKLTEAEVLRNGYYASMRMLFYIGLMVLVLAFFGAAVETAFHGLPGARRGIIVPAYDLWYTFSPTTLLILEIRVSTLFGQWLWDPVLLTLLKLPAWLLTGIPGIGLIMLSRRNRRVPGLDAEEEKRAVNESFHLFNDLTRQAKAENPPGENHGPQDIMPENPIGEDEIITLEDIEKFESEEKEKEDKT